MPPLIAADLLLGLLAISGAVLIGRRVTRQAPAAPDDLVALADMASALRVWGAAILILGVLGISGLPGGFDEPLWSAAALVLGAVSAAIFVVRWRYEEWVLNGALATADGPVIESETSQYALLVGGAATFVAYFVGLSIGLMQPVHAVVAVLEGTAAGALGYALWTPRTAIRRRRPDPDAVEGPPTGRGGPRR